MTSILNTKKIHQAGYAAACFCVGLVLSIPFFTPHYTYKGAEPLTRFTASPSFVVVHNINRASDNKPSTALIRLRDTAPHIIEGKWNTSFDHDGAQVALFNETQVVLFTKNGKVRNITVGKNNQLVRSILFSPDGNYLAVVTAKGSGTNVCTVKIAKLDDQNPECNTSQIPTGEPKTIWHPDLDHTFLVDMSDVLISAWFYDDRAPVSIDPGSPKLGFSAAKKTISMQSEKNNPPTSRTNLFYNEFSVAATFNGIEFTDRRTFEKNFIPYSTIGLTPNSWELPHVSVPN